MDSALEYILSHACGLLWPCPVVPSAQAATSQRPGVDNAYSLLRAPERVWLEAQVSPRVEEGGKMLR
jgi:hypothetical protein